MKNLLFWLLSILACLILARYINNGWDDFSIMINDFQYLYNLTFGL